MISLMLISLKENKKILNMQKLIQCKKVPAIQDGDFSLYESSAIATYLFEIANTDDHWYPKCHKKRNIVNQWLHWNHTNSTKAFGGLFGNEVVMKKVMKKEPREEVVKELHELAVNSLKFLENTLSKSKFLTGDEITIADVAIGSVLDQLVVGLKYDISSYTHVEKWYNGLVGLEHWKSNRKALDSFVESLN